MTEQKPLIENAFLRCKSQLMRVIGRYLGLPPKADNVVQEASIRSAQPDITKIEQSEHYPIRTARNLSLNELTHSSYKLAGSIEDLELPEVLYVEDSVLQQTECSEQLTIFCAAARTLSEQCRKVFILKKAYGLSQAEISKRLNITVNTANEHQAKALARITEHMRSKGYLKDSKVAASQPIND